MRTTSTRQDRRSAATRLLTLSASLACLLLGVAAPAAHAGGQAPVQLTATPPDAPVLTGTDPASPANNNFPLVQGNAPPSTLVRIYTTPDCTGPVAAEGTSADLAAGIQVAVLNDTATTFRATSTDLTENLSACSDPLDYVEDSTAPETTIDSGPSDPTVATSATFAFSASEPGATFDCRLDNAPLAPCASSQSYSNLATGTHTFQVRSTDAAGNVDTSPASRQFTVAGAPSLTSTSPASPANQNSPRVIGAAASGLTVKLYSSADCSGAAVAQGSAADLASPGLQVSVPDNSSTDLRATATDGDGNVSACSAPITYVEDSAAPDTSITSGPSGVTGISSPSFGFTSTEGSSTFTCSLDGAAFASCSSPKSYAGLSDGTHTFKVKAVDAAGNTDASPATRSFTVDTVPPGPPALTATSPASPANQNSPRVIGTAASGSTVRVYTSSDCSGTPAVQGAATALASPGLVVSVANDTTTAFRATATDSAGNASACSGAITYVEDSTAPDTTITSGPSGSTGNSSPSFSFTSTESPATFTCSMDSAPYSACTSPQAYSGLADGSHTFRVKAADAAGNADGSPATRSFTINTAVVGTPSLTSTTPASPANQNSPKIVGSAPAGSTVRLYTTSDCSGASVAQGTAAALASPGLPVSVPDNSSTTFRATATSGNTSACSAPITYVEDSAAPETTITSGPSGTIGVTSADFAFSSSESPSTFTCSLDSAAFTPCTSPQSYTGLAPGSHSFRVKATDAAKNVDATPATRSFTVNTSAPAAPALTSTSPASPANQNSPKIVGSAAASSTVKLYATSDCSGTPLAQGTAAALASPGIAISVADNTSTTIRATATLGGTSPCSGPITYVEDSAAPDGSVTSGPTGPTNNSSPSFGFSSSEPGSTFTCSLDTAAFTPCTSPKDFTALPDGSHNFRVKAIDAAGNVDATPASRSFTVDTVAPNPVNVTAMSPASPANQNSPRVIGTAAASTTVRVYAGADCSGTVAAQGTSAAFSSPGLQVSVPDNSSTTFRATATDAAGNASACTGRSTTYVEDSVAPDTTIRSGPSGTTFDPSPTFEMSSTETGTFACNLDGAGFQPCSSPKTYAAIGNGQHTVQIRAADPAGNADPTPDARTFTVTQTDDPNILLIITDDQPLDTMQEMPRTAQYFGQNGVEFKQGYVTTPLCCPSRASIFSGKYAHNHGVFINDGNNFDATETWQRYLHDAGYETGILGKYLNLVPTTAAPYFDVRQSWAYDDPEQSREIETAAEQFLAGADTEDSQPWALVYSTSVPHYPWNEQPLNPAPIDPYNAPPSLNESDLSDKHPAVAGQQPPWTPDQTAPIRNGMLTELQSADEQLGRLYNTVDQLGETQNTLVIFMSDNGFLWGQHSLGPGKEWPYLETVHVPFFMSWPGHVTPGSTSNDMVANIDIAPTIFQATGINPAYPVDGQPLLGSDPRSWLLTEYLTHDNPMVPTWSAYVSPTRHYIEWQDGSGFVEDYNLSTDPFELAASNQADPSFARHSAAAGTWVGAAVCP
jgi:arylsulfatase A-like enzyme